MHMPSSRSLALALVATMLVLVSCAFPRSAASQALRARVGTYELELLVDRVPARTFTHAGETHVLGQQGSRYVLRIHNRSDGRIEAVAAVDGLDVIDGKSADFGNKRGYLVPAHGHVDIEGWRLSEREAAAFRFAPVSESYAAKTGSARNVGVIGVAIFPEQNVRPAPVYAPAPSYARPRAPSASPQPSPPRSSSLSSQAPDDFGGGTGAPAKSRAESGAAAQPALRANAAADEAESKRAKAPAERDTARRARSGLGTEFGESLSSAIQQVAFVRAQPSRPAALLGARYNDRAGLHALGIDVDGEREPSEFTLRQT